MTTSATMDMEQFIREMQARPALWRAKHPQHRHKKVVNRKWEEVRARFPDFTISELRKKWKNLKDTYRKELKKAHLDPSLPAQSQWVHFEAVDFLRGECLPAGLAESTQDEEDNNVLDDQVSSSDEYQETETQKSMASSPLLTHLRSDVISSSRKTKMPQDIHAEQIEIERKKFKILEREMEMQSNMNKSDNYYFLMSILPEMDKLPPLQKFRLRNKINQALMDEITMSMFADHPLDAIPGQSACEVALAEDCKAAIHKFENT